MKRFLLIVVGLVATLLLIGALVLRFGLGIGVPSPTEVFNVAGGMAAKLGCSARHLTGLSPAQVTADLKSYSSAYGWVNITNIDDEGRVEARLPPGDAHSATYRAGLGCTLDIGDTRALDEVNLPQRVSAQPRNTGEHNELLTSQLRNDNSHKNKDYQTRALLIMHNGQIVGEAHADGFNRNTPHLGWSMGKSLISILLGQLEQAGQLDVTQQQLFADWSDERQQISIADLLHMTSGLDFEEQYLPGSDATRMLFNEYSASSVALAKPAVHEPGTHFAYSSGTSNILSRLLFDRLGGSPANAYAWLHNTLLGPLDMNHTIVEPDPSGVFVGSSYVYASASDWGKLGQLLVAGGMHKGRQLLSPDWIQRATTPNSSTNERRYGYQLWLNRGGPELRWPDLPEDAFAMQGNRAQIVLMIPSRNVVFVRLGWSSSGYPYNDTFAEWLTKLATQS